MQFVLLPQLLKSLLLGNGTVQISDSRRTCVPGALNNGLDDALGFLDERALALQLCWILIYTHTRLQLCLGSL